MPATADVTIKSLVETVAATKPDCSNLTLQYDNSSQYADKKFKRPLLF